MPRPGHLTRGDARFLASVQADPVRKLDVLLDLTDELLDAADVAGIEADLSALEALEDDATFDEPDRLDAIISGLSRQRGGIARGEFTTDTTEETSEDDVLPE
jgi:hypothetical protein